MTCDHDSLMSINETNNYGRANISEEKDNYALNENRFLKMLFIIQTKWTNTCPLELHNIPRQ